MDEVRKSKNLMAEILARAASIKQHMAQVSQAMSNMKMIEDAANAAQVQGQVVQLMDLPDGCLMTLTAQLKDVRSLLALAQTCKRMKQMIEEDSNSWEERCRAEWSIAAAHPSDVIRLGQMLASSEDFGRDEDGAERSSRSSASSMGTFQGLRPCSSWLKGGNSMSLQRSDSSKGPTSPTATQPSPPPPAPSSTPLPSSQASLAALWRAVYKDRCQLLATPSQGWALAMDMLTWLRDHGAPASVTGNLHRMQLNLALSYMTLCTSHQQDVARRRRILDDGVKCIVALLDNESVGTAEMAMQLLGNLIWQDQETKVSVLMLTQMGKSLSDKLDGVKTLPGMVQQASRVLVSLWAEAATVPDIPLASATPFSATATPQTVSWASGTSQSVALQEYTLRGESMRQLRFPIQFSEGQSPGKVHFSGSGQDPDAGEFTVSGVLDNDTGYWMFTRCPSTGLQTTVTYKGYSDGCGSWGTYSSPMGRQLRVFRLFVVPLPA